MGLVVNAHNLTKSMSVEGRGEGKRGFGCSSLCAHTREHHSREVIRYFSNCNLNFWCDETHGAWICRHGKQLIWCVETSRGMMEASKNKDQQILEDTVLQLNEELEEALQVC